MMIVFTLLIGVFLVVYLVMGLVFLLGLFQPSPSRNSLRPFVSVIIAARNEQENIINCLQSVIAQTYPKDQFEIIVVDDRSEDKTSESVLSLAKDHPQLKLIWVSEKQDKISGKKNALDKGIRESRGDILLFTDADCRVKSTWIEGMVSYFDDKVGAVIGFSSVVSGSFFEQLQAYDFLALMTAACGAANFGLPLAASGQNLAYRRRTFEEAGGFKKIMERISGDDTLMIQQIRKNTSYKIVFAGKRETYNTTRPMTSMKTFIEQRSRWASNGTIMISLNPLFFFYLICVYGLHALLAGGLIAGFFYRPALIVSVFVWLTRFVVDFALMYNGSRAFNTPFSLKIFLMWFFFQTPLILLAGIKGSVGYFKWK